MKFKKAVVSFLAGVTAAACAATAVEAQQNPDAQGSSQIGVQNTSNKTPRDAPGEAPGQATISLEELERMALANNPTVAQAEAAIRSAEGRRKQAGLWPNPIIGYEADGLAFNDVVRQF